MSKGEVKDSRTCVPFDRAWQNGDELCAEATRQGIVRSRLGRIHENANVPRRRNHARRLADALLRRKARQHPSVWLGAPRAQVRRAAPFASQQFPQLSVTVATVCFSKIWQRERLIKTALLKFFGDLNRWTISPVYIATDCRE